MNAVPQPRQVSLLWLAVHELRLSWRDWQMMMTAGNRRNFSTALVILAAIGVGLHMPAYAVVGHFGQDGVPINKSTLFTVSLVVVLYVSLLLSQAMEAVTRTLYSRGDLDLVLSSPVTPLRLFSVRIVINALLIGLIALVLSAPLVDVLIMTGGPHWFTAYAVALSVGLTSGVLAVAITLGLFRLLGPRRTRIVAQVLAAIIGAAFAIGIQVIAIVNYGTFSRQVFTPSDETIAGAPGAGNLIWLPARAILGDVWALVAVVAACAAIIAAVILVFAPKLGENSIAATDLPASLRRRQRARRSFRAVSAAAAMRRKEWLLIRRDPWLISQTLTQLLYLLPPALLLMRNFGNSTGIYVILVMVLVTVGGQLAGALAWLAISGEDAPDLVRTAPVAPSAVTRAKVEAVLGAVAAILGALVVGLAFLSPWHALAAGLGVFCAAASTIRIQLWFRAQAKRTNFRRRHTSSRIATFGEALVSFSWAGAAGLAAAGTWIAAISVAMALVILGVVRAVSPRKAAA